MLAIADMYFVFAYNIILNRTKIGLIMFGHSLLQVQIMK